MRTRSRPVPDNAQHECVRITGGVGQSRRRDEHDAAIAVRLQPGFAGARRERAALGGPPRAGTGLRRVERPRERPGRRADGHRRRGLQRRCGRRVLRQVDALDDATTRHRRAARRSTRTTTPRRQTRRRTRGDARACSCHVCAAQGVPARHFRSARRTRASLRLPGDPPGALSSMRCEFDRSGPHARRRMTSGCRSRNGNARIVRDWAGFVDGRSQPGRGEGTGCHGRDG